MINRKELLRALEACVPGLSAKENIEQSSCFIFSENSITTFNDEILCVHDTPLGLHGAVPSKPLLELLRKLTEDEIQITSTDTELRIKGNGRRVVIRMSPDVLLPTGVVDPVEEWIDVPPAFGDALSMVAECASKSGDDRELSCVHFQPHMIEACDRYQAIRYNVETGVGQNALIRRSSCAAVQGLGIAGMAETEVWMHWKTYTGLQVSVRKYASTFPSLDDIFATEKTGEAHIPGSIVEIFNRAAPFFADTTKGKQGLIRLRKGQMMIRAANGEGWYEEIRDIDYDGPKMTLGVNPKYISGLVKHGIPCDITASSLRITGDAFVYALPLENIAGDN